ncbi:MAG: glutathione S-transferase N-terminal domain-containing protein [Betaproteobacteria bacterium]|nr:glutathione S-transferase N-terminal domain-containing protein [Betaproteobacteria bacterium]
MTDTRPGADTCTLWGGALSLYTGKVRSYLIKKGVPYREFYASHPDFQARIRPVVGLGVTPVLETPDGDILQDSTEIIEAMERRLPERPMIPATPVLRALAWLLDAYGSEYLLAMAMHFRWAEPHISLQRSFLQAEFGRASYLGTDKAARDQAGARMVSYFSSMLGPLGSNAHTAEAIETEFFDLLDVLDEHFQHVPYLLGGPPQPGGLRLHGAAVRAPGA